MRVQASAETRYAAKADHEGTVSLACVQTLQKGIKLGCGLQTDGFGLTGNQPKLGMQLFLG